MTQTDLILPFVVFSEWNTAGGRLRVDDDLLDAETIQSC